jgi:hypothetical protein
MLVCLLAEFVSGQVIFFTMGGRRGRVVVGRKVVQLGKSIMGALWHCCSPGRVFANNRSG